MQAVESAALGEIATEIRDKLQKYLRCSLVFNSALIQQVKLHLR
jgi:hypothetical protein